VFLLHRLGVSSKLWLMLFSDQWFGVALARSNDILHSVTMLQLCSSLQCLICDYTHCTHILLTGPVLSHQESGSIMLIMVSFNNVRFQHGDITESQAFSIG